MPLLGLLPFLRVRFGENGIVHTVCQCPYSGYFFFYPILWAKILIFQAFPAFSFFLHFFTNFLLTWHISALFYIYITLTKRFRTFFQKVILTFCSPLCYPALSFLVKVLKLHRPYKRHSTELFSASLCLSLLAISLLPFSCPNFGVHMALQNPVKKCDIVIFFQSFYI